MYKGKKFLGIIPARGGSKRLPKKNIKELCGRPLVEWSIEAAKQSKYVDSIVVSSDNKNILSIAEKQNVDTIIRPDFLADDKSTAINVLLHTLEQIKDTYDYVVLLQPTSPLRSNLDIDNSIEMLMRYKAKAEKKGKVFAPRKYSLDQRIAFAEYVGNIVKTMKKRYPDIRLLATGGIRLENVEAYAKTGVDGLITTAPYYYAAPADIGVKIEKIQKRVFI
jgi:CMP-N-acetylneuraminic acid synthetase